MSSSIDFFSLVMYESADKQVDPNPEAEIRVNRNKHGQANKRGQVINKQAIKCKILNSCTRGKTLRLSDNWQIDTEGIPFKVSL